MEMNEETGLHSYGMLAGLGQKPDSFWPESFWWGHVCGRTYKPKEQGNRRKEQGNRRKA